MLQYESDCLVTPCNVCSLFVWLRSRLGGESIVKSFGNYLSLFNYHFEHLC